MCVEAGKILAKIKVEPEGNEFLGELKSASL
jgi:hypothetical protein